MRSIRVWLTASTIFMLLLGFIAHAFARVDSCNGTWNYASQTLSCSGGCPVGYDESCHEVSIGVNKTACGCSGPSGTIIPACCHTVNNNGTPAAKGSCGLSGCPGTICGLSTFSVDGVNISSTAVCAG